jgi:hypothetical protein
MTIEEQVLEKLRELPPEKQKEVLEFVGLLQRDGGTRNPRRGLLQLWTDLSTEITEEDMAETRREMWGSFPGTAAGGPDVKC